jgi:hypothetical protein
MSHLTNRLNPLFRRRWRFTTSRAVRAGRSNHDALYRRAVVEQLEDRRALDAAAVASGLQVQFDGADSGQIEFATFSRPLVNEGFKPWLTATGKDASMSRLRLSTDQAPILSLRPPGSQPIAISIDRIQATAGVETSVELRRPTVEATIGRQTQPPLTPTAGDSIGRSAGENSGVGSQSRGSVPIAERSADIDRKGIGHCARDKEYSRVVAHQVCIKEHIRSAIGGAECYSCGGRRV